MLKQYHRELTLSKDCFHVRIGEVVPVDVIAEGKPRRFEVPTTGYDRHRVRIVERPDATPSQRQRRLKWEAAGTGSGL